MDDAKSEEKNSVKPASRDSGIFLIVAAAVAIALLAGAFILFFNPNPPQPTPTPSFAPSPSSSPYPSASPTQGAGMKLGFDYEMSNCSTIYPKSAIPIQPFNTTFTQVGNAVKVSQSFVYSNCSEVRMYYNVPEDEVILLVMREISRTEENCAFACLRTMNATVYGIPDGSYSVQLVGVKREGDSRANFLGEINITVPQKTGFLNESNFSAGE